MDFKLILATFAAVFVAELADKTQIVGISLASKSLKPLSVFLGSVTAYMVITALSVLIGANLGKYIRPEYLKFGGGLLFIGIGILILFEKI